MQDHSRNTNWINQVLEEFSISGQQLGIDILLNCGEQCCEESDMFQTVLEFKKLNPELKHSKDIIHKFIEAHYSSENLYINENQITLIFDKCTCSLVKNGVDHPFLCHCTSAYSKKIFETLLEKKVKVEVLESILKGNEKCIQLIEIIN